MGRLPPLLVVLLPLWLVVQLPPPMVVPLLPWSMSWLPSRLVAQRVQVLPLQGKFIPALTLGYISTGIA